MAITKKAESSIIRFLKIRNVKSPERAYKYDAGIDFFVPEFNASFIKDLKKKNPIIFEYSIFKNVIGFDEEKGKNYVLLSPQLRIMIPSGIKSKMDTVGKALIASNKSGIATKYGLVFGAQTVDYSYMGEIHISVINTSDKTVKIYEDMKLSQFIETPVFFSNIEIKDITSFIDDPPAFEDEEDEFWENHRRDRLDGGFGSTDKK